MIVTLNANRRAVNLQNSANITMIFQPLAELFLGMWEGG
jgi:hypothetical protein